MNANLLISEIAAARALDQKQAESIFSPAFDPFRQYLYDEADRVRRQMVGDDVYLRGLIEFSNYCRCGCAYCGISAQNPKISRYRMDVHQIRESVAQAFKLGYRSYVLQSGEDPAYSGADICNMIESIKNDFPVALTLSIGEWKKEDLKNFKAAGADRYLLRIETANPVLFARLHPDSNWEDRHACLMNLKELGFQVGSGVLIGLPGQDPAGLHQDLEYLKRLEPEMVGIGPFIPHPDTPLGNEPGGALDKCLTFLALLRLLLPDAFLPATTAMGSISPNGRQKALLVGANVLMPNVSPQENRSKYELYPAKICLADDATTCRGCIERMVASLGRKINLGHGHITRHAY